MGSATLYFTAYMLLFFYKKQQQLPLHARKNCERFIDLELMGVVGACLVSVVIRC